MSSIFLSHSHADKEIARRIARDLRNDGVTVWIDEVELDIGDSLFQEIGTAITTVDFLGVLISSNSVKSNWVSREIEIALNDEIVDGNVKVLPFLVDDCEIPTFLRGKLYADFRDPKMYDVELSKILKCMGVALGETTGKTTVIFDESYNQERWYAQPIVSAGYSAVADQIAQEYTVITNNSGYLPMDCLLANSILVLPMPFGTMVDDQQYAEITKWVNRGGGLLLLGFYLMEAHHYSNLNNLTRRIGFDFSHDLTMPKGYEGFHQCMDQAFAFTNRDYWIQTSIFGEPVSHPLLAGIEKVVLTSSCTIEPAAKPEVLVSTSKSVALLNARGHKNPQGRLIQLTDYVLNKYSQAPFLVALRYGSGRVVGIGTWKIFINELISAGFDNFKLFQNVIAWLAKAGTMEYSAD